MIDVDTIASERSFEAALHAAGGAADAAERLLAGEDSFAFCGLRPPGHHAERARAMGFCLFNNVAVAARARDRGVRRRARAGARLGRPSRQRDRGDLRRVRRGPLREHPPVAALSRDRRPPSTRATAAGRATRSTCPCRRARAPTSSSRSCRTWWRRSRATSARACSRSRPATTPTATIRSRSASWTPRATRTWPRSCATLAAELGVPVLVCLEGGYAPEALAESVLATIEALEGDREPAEAAAELAAALRRAPPGPVAGARALRG